MLSLCSRVCTRRASTNSIEITSLMLLPRQEAGFFYGPRFLQRKEQQTPPSDFIQTLSMCSCIRNGCRVTLHMLTRQLPLLLLLLLLRVAFFALLHPFLLATTTLFA